MPGEHTVIVGTVSDALKARRTGLHLRDTLTLLLPEARVLTAFLFRQPLEGTVAQNILRHSQGGLNIDRCRVGYGGKSLETVRKEAGSPGKHSQNCQVEYSGGWGERGGVEFHPGGRWPTNLILVHGPECYRVGDKRVPGINKPGSVGGKRHNSTYAQDVYSKTYERTLRQCHASPDGTETIPAYDCEPDCPVRMLDEMSGITRNGGQNRTCDKDHSVIYDGGWAGGDDGATRFANDTGTASRFYPQFTCLDDALDWLAHLTGQSPV